MLVVDGATVWGGLGPWLTLWRRVMPPPGVLFVVCLETPTERCCGLLF